MRPVRRVAGRTLSILALAAMIAGLDGAPARAQLPQTRLYSILPCGAQIGSTVDLTLNSGVDLDEVDRLLFNHPGISAAPKTRQNAGRTEPVPNVFVVTVRPDVPPGVYEVYARGLFGLSNPRAFVVESRPELFETEPNNDRDKPNEVPLDRTINGVIGSATDVDYFRFQGRRGQRILASCRASDIDSRLSAVLELIGTDGRRLAYARAQLRHDPVIDVTLPADGAYLLKVHDFVFRGGPEFVYRLLIGTAPYVDYIVPAAGVPGSTAKYTLYGRNLPGGQDSGVKVDGRPLEKLQVDIALPAAPQIAPAHTTLRSTDAGMPSVSYVLKSPAGESNPVLIQFAPSVPIIEKEPNDTPAQAQRITAPGEFFGQFQAPGDTDYLTFEAKAGEVFYLDVIADRLGSMADPYLVVDQVVRDAKGVESTTRITALDDDNSNIAANVFDTRTDDPSFRFQAPATGTYRIELRDRSFETRGDPRLVYRLSLRPESRDFAFVALPRHPVEGSFAGVSTWGLNLRKGDNRDLQVLALRRDGFEEPIDLYAEGLPAGVSCRGTTLARNAKTGELIFSAAENAPEWAGLIRILGKAHVTEPAKVKALAAADTAVKAAANASAAADAIAAPLADAAKRSLEIAETLKRAAQASPKDQAVAQAAADARTAADSAARASKSSAQTAADAKKSLADAQAAQKAAATNAKPREIVHEAIPGAIVWSSTGPNAPTVARIGQSLALSVMKESAPFEVADDAQRIEANRGRQILIKRSLIKRNGFDADVALTLAGLPDGTNIEFKNQNIAKGKLDDVIRLYVKPDARVGTYSLYWKAQADVAYRRNPFAEERAKAEQAVATKASADAAATLKAAVAARDAAIKAQTTAETAAKTAKAKQSAAQQALAAAQGSLTASAAQKVKLELAALEPAALAEATAKVGEFARKAADEAALTAKSASGAAKSAADANAAAAAKVAQGIKKAAAEAADAARAAMIAASDAAKKLADADAAVKKLTEETASAQKSLADADVAVRRAAESRKPLEAAAAAADAKAKAVAAEKAAADQRADQATKAAAPQNVKEFALSAPFELIVKPAPVALTAAVSGDGSLKKGAKIAVKVSVRRVNGFQGPVTVNFPLPPGVTGIEASPLVIPQGKTEGTLTISAGPSAVAGAPANLVVRAQMEFEGRAEVDAPLALKIVP